MAYRIEDDGFEVEITEDRNGPYKNWEAVQDHFQGAEDEKDMDQLFVDEDSKEHRLLERRQRIMEIITDSESFAEYEALIVQVERVD